MSVCDVRYLLKLCCLHGVKGVRQRIWMISISQPEVGGGMDSRLVYQWVLHVTCWSCVVFILCKEWGRGYEWLGSQPEVGGGMDRRLVYQWVLCVTCWSCVVFIVSKEWDRGYAWLSFLVETISLFVCLYWQHAAGQFRPSVYIHHHWIGTGYAQCSLKI